MFESINDVKIIGRAPALNDIIVQMDQSMQEIANDTEIIKSIILTYGDSIYGEQYQTVCASVQELSSILVQASEYINSVQHDLVRYIDDVDSFQGRAPSALPAMPHNVQVVNVEANIAHDQFTKDEYLLILNTLRNYINATLERKIKILRDKSNIGAIWQDSQYTQFSDAIDEIASIIDQGAMILDDYANYLSTIIANL